MDNPLTRCFRPAEVEHGVIIAAPVMRPLTNFACPELIFQIVLLVKCGSRIGKKQFVSATQALVGI